MNKLTTITAGFCLALTVSAALAAPPPPAAPRTLHESGTISGQVQNAAGKPLFHVQVIIIDTGEVALTDKDGKFVFVGEDLQAYTLRASAAGYEAVTAKATATTGINFASNFTLKVKPAAVKTQTKYGGIVLDGRRIPAPNPFANDPLSSFQGDLGLHSTARSR